jgi:hypothetical protein
MHITIQKICIHIVDMIKPIIILLLVLIIIFSIGISTNSKEGFVDYMNPMPEMVKDIRQTSDSDKMIILFEVYSNVQKHEKAMSIYDPAYKPIEVKMNPKNSILNNIKRLYPILYKQDKELIILTKNEYVPSKTLKQLMDGSLIKPMKDDLTKIMNYPARPIMDQPETDIPTILDNAKRYQQKADDIERIKQHKINLSNSAQRYRNAANERYEAANRSDRSSRYYIGSKRDRLRRERDDRRREGDRNMELANRFQRASDSVIVPDENMKKDFLDKVKELKLDAVKKEILNIPGFKIPVDTSPRITQADIDSRIETATLFHLTKIIKYHDYALESVSKNAENYIKKIYAVPIEL